MTEAVKQDHDIVGWCWSFKTVPGEIEWRKGSILCSVFLDMLKRPTTSGMYPFFKLHNGQIIRMKLK